MFIAAYYFLPSIWQILDKWSISLMKLNLNGSYITPSLVKVFSSSFFGSNFIPS